MTDLHHRFITQLLSLGLSPWQFIYDAMTAPFQTPFTGSPLRIFIGLVASPLLAALGLATLLIATVAILLVSVGFAIYAPFAAPIHQDARLQATNNAKQDITINQSRRPDLPTIDSSPRSAGLQLCFFKRALSVPIIEEEANDMGELDEQNFMLCDAPSSPPLLPQGRRE